MYECHVYESVDDRCLSSHFYTSKIDGKQILGYIWLSFIKGSPGHAQYAFAVRKNIGSNERDRRVTSLAI